MAHATSIPTPKSAAETDIDGGAAAGSIISTLHPDIIQTHILTRLDVSALASAATTCTQLYALASQEDVWANLCHSTWPSTSSPRVRHVIRSFHHGSRSFFFDCSTIPRPIPTTPPNSHMDLDRTPQLISAVDFWCRGQLLLSRVVETETVSDRFRGSPFHVDTLEPKDVVQTPMRYPEEEDEWWGLAKELRLHWILIGTSGRRAMNILNRNVVSIKRRSLDEMVEFRFVRVLEGEKGTSTELTLCSVGVRVVGVEGGEMRVRQVSLEMEGMTGRHLNGRESLVILQRMLEGKRESLKEARERKERMNRREWPLDLGCVIVAALSFVGLIWLRLGPRWEGRWQRLVHRKA